MTTQPPGACRCVTKWLTITLTGVIYVLELICYEYIGLFKLAYQIFNWPIAVICVCSFIFIFFWGLALASYLSCAIVDPGYLTELSKDCRNADLPVVAKERRYLPQRIQFCPKCEMHRPERAHHCSFCGKCVLRMDHHCPWIGNCIGLFNLRFFIQFAGYTCIACIIASASTVAVFVCSLQDNSSANSPVLSSIFYVGFLTWITFGLATGTLFCYHIHLLMHNGTTLEECYPFANPYDIDKTTNIKQIFGNHFFTWILPINYKNIDAIDGVNYQSKLSVGVCSVMTPLKEDPICKRPSSTSTEYPPV